MVFHPAWALFSCIQVVIPLSGCSLLLLFLVVDGVSPRLVAFLVHPVVVPLSGWSSSLLLLLFHSAWSLFSFIRSLFLCLVVRCYCCFLSLMVFHPAWSLFSFIRSLFLCLVGRRRCCCCCFTPPGRFSRSSGRYSFVWLFVVVVVVSCFCWCCFTPPGRVSRSSRSLDGTGNFNWRMLFPFEFFPIDKKLVVRKKVWSPQIHQLAVVMLSKICSRSLYHHLKWPSSTQRGKEAKSVIPCVKPAIMISNALIGRISVSIPV